MAIGFARVGIIGMSQGKNVVASAAYILREKMTSNSERRTFDFSHMDQRDVLTSGVMLPAGMSNEYADPTRLWQAVEEKEHALIDDPSRYKNDGIREYQRGRVQFAKHLVLALPRDHQITDSDHITMVSDFVYSNFVSKGVPTSYAIHIDNPENPHAHVLIGTRRWDVKENDFSNKKARDLNPVFAKGAVTQGDHWELKWTDYQNEYFRSIGIDLAVDPFHVVKGTHVGKDGVHGSPEDVNLYDQVRGEQIQASREAIIEGPMKIVHELTRSDSYFSSEQLKIALIRNGFDSSEVPIMHDVVMGRPEVVSLRSKEQREAIKLFSTKEIVRSDRAVVQLGKYLNQRKSFDISFNETEFEGQPFNKEAAKSLIEGPDIGLLQGRAGTGKSSTLSVVSAAHGQAGKYVIGLAPTNLVADDMRNFVEDARTIDSFLASFDLRGDFLEPGSVIMVDESGMLGGEKAEKLMTIAVQGGHKILFVGDTQQLSSIDRGMPFKDLVDRLDHSVLEDVFRQNNPEHRRASIAFSQNYVAEALRVYANEGSILTHETHSQSISALIDTWSKSEAEQRFIVAVKRSDVGVLNQRAHNVMVQQGRVTDQQYFDTNAGPRKIGVGEKIIFHGTEKLTEAHKDADGLRIVNGMRGTVTGIEDGLISFKDDNSGRSMTFDPQVFNQFDYGYAGTVYKAQGATIDDTFILITDGMDRRNAYVAITRHRENVKMFTNREHVYFDPNDRASITQLGQKLGWTHLQGSTMDYNYDTPKVDEAVVSQGQYGEVDLRARLRGHEIKTVDELLKNLPDVVNVELSKLAPEAKESLLKLAIDLDQKQRSRDAWVAENTPQSSRVYQQTKNVANSSFRLAAANTPVLRESMVFKDAVTRVMRSRGAKLPGVVGSQVVYKVASKVPGVAMALKIYNTARMLGRIGRGIAAISQSVSETQSPSLGEKVSKAMESGLKVTPVSGPFQTTVHHHHVEAYLNKAMSKWDMPKQNVWSSVGETAPAKMPSVDIYGRSLDVKSVLAEVQAEEMGKGARLRINRALERIYADPIEASKVLNTLVNEYGGKISIEMFTKDPKILGEISSDLTDERKLVRIVNGMSQALNTIASAERRVLTSYVKDVSRQIRADVRPAATLSKATVSALKRIDGEPSEHKQAAMMRTLLKDKIAKREIEMMRRNVVPRLRVADKVGGIAEARNAYINATRNGIATGLLPAKALPGINLAVAVFQFADKAYTAMSNTTSQAQTQKNQTSFKF